MTGTLFERLIDIMATLRSPEGCPWDREQTHETLRPFLLEESYEVLESIDRNDFESLKEELGDLLLQVVFHSQLAKEQDRFSVDDVLETVNEKLTRRHPHVFGDATIHSAEEQRVHWEKIKKKEGKDSVLDGVPQALPALIRATRIQQKASTVGFDWKHRKDVLKKVEEEWEELQSAIDSEKQECIEEELGDLLFALANLSRFVKLNPEDALRRAIHKFEKRFKQVESELASQNKDIHDASLDEMDTIWNRVKKNSS